MSMGLDTNKHGSVAEYVQDNTFRKANIDVTSFIFTNYAYDELKKVLDDTNKFRVLFNETTFIEKLESNQKEAKEFQLQMLQRERNVSEYLLEIALKNNLDQNQVANKCYQFIQSKVEVESILTERNVIDDFESFYNSVWNNLSLVVDVKETLLEHTTNLYRENAPELVYFVTLNHLFIKN